MLQRLNDQGWRRRSFCLRAAWWALVVSLAVSSASAMPPDFVSARTPGYIGVASTSSWRSTSIYASVQNNDFIGQTDKLVSGSNQISFLWALKPESFVVSSIEASLYWLAITPSYRPRDGSQSFVTPVGFYADWLDFQVAIAQTRWFDFGGLKLNVAATVGDIADHGMEKVHTSLHELVGQPVSDIDYSGAKERKTQGGDIAVSYLLLPFDCNSWRVSAELSVGRSKNVFFDESYADFRLGMRTSEEYQLGVTTRFVRPLAVRVYDKVNPFRYESAITLRWGGWMPSLRYVSAYLPADTHPQLYADLLSWNFEF